MCIVADSADQHGVGREPAKDVAVAEGPVDQCHQGFVSDIVLVVEGGSEFGQDLSSTDGDGLFAGAAAVFLVFLF